MDEQDLNSRIVARGEELLMALEGEKPSLFEKGRWVGKMMDWALRHDAFRTQLLRFVDVFPTLSTPSSLADHLSEYFDLPGNAVPGPVRWSISAARGGGRVGASILGRAITYSIGKLGSQFIVGETTRQALKNLSKIRREGCAFSIDILGEAVLSEDEAEHYADEYRDLIAALTEAQRAWPPLPGGRDEAGPGALDWGFMPKVNISLKPTSLYSQTRPQDFDGSVSGILKRLRPLYEELMRAGGTLCIDMESYQYKDISLELFRRLRLEYPDYPHLCIVLQAYLRDMDVDVPELLDWARQHHTPIAIRLVKGAYWDYEIIRARQNGWELPVYTRKPDTDAAFERLAGVILGHHDVAYLACGSHNIRSIAAVLELARYMEVPETRYEFQVLYGMAEPIRNVLRKKVGRVRVYSPYGLIVPGMAYLVRRLIENTANQSFLRLMFAERVDTARLLRDPSLPFEEPQVSSEAADEGALLPPFQNQPPSDFTRQSERHLFVQSIAAVRERMGGVCALHINGADRTTADRITSVNPANQEEIVAEVCQAGLAEADEALLAASSAFDEWRDTDPWVRADYLIRAAAAMRERRHELAAWQILEIGKQWDQASADVAEAIDFLEYYARQTIRLGKPERLVSPPGEVNVQFYEPRGVAVVIAPWNFPLAISTGMVSAAIVTGNCVVYKPSPLTPVIGRHLVDAFREAGLPPGVLNFVPGRTEIIAEHLIDHPSVSTIAFTGSTQVGMKILEKAAHVHPGQVNVKRLICEMGGKNAIIIDDDADLDEAIPGVIASAFGFQGQKCSSCSRVIVLESIYDGFVERLVAAAKALPVGPAEDPAFVVGPVSDTQARNRIMGYIGLAGQEAKVLYSGATPPGANYVPVTIVGDVRPEHRIAQEEIFGPVLAVMKVKSFKQALEWANSTRFALTGGVFSRNPRHLKEATRKFRVGNLYLNRSITGALVGRQPFGGFRLSGLGTKAGGPEYLLHFMDPRVVTENTARRGFAPDVG